MSCNRHIPMILSLALVIASCSTEPVPAAAQTAGEDEEMSSSLETEDEKILYALGIAMSQNFGAFGLTEEELATVQQGIADGVLKRDSKVDMQSYGPRIQTFAQGRVARAAAAEKESAAGFLEEMAAEEGAESMDSGLIYTQISAGNGASPAASDQVTVHYHGTLHDGTVFDSSRDRGQPATFALNGVIPCWTEGVQKIKVGGKSKLVCPAAIAYGDQGRPPTIPGGAALIFEVELISIGGQE
ncbi:MAG: FKBP-type peptidyl-prolyl cis-trans isomerase [Thermoanaerobaculia bacterium]